MDQIKDGAEDMPLQDTEEDEAVDALIAALFRKHGDPSAVIDEEDVSPTPHRSVRRASPAKAKREQIINSFTYHPPRPGDKERYTRITDTFLEMALFVYDSTPESREQSLAITYLQIARMLANAAIACEEQAV